jgi:hypothetical protein
MSSKVVAAAVLATLTLAFSAPARLLVVLSRAALRLLASASSSFPGRTVTRAENMLERAAIVGLGGVVFVVLALTGALKAPSPAAAIQYCVQGCSPLVPPLIAFQSSRDHPAATPRCTS